MNNFLLKKKKCTFKKSICPDYHKCQQKDNSSGNLNQTGTFDQYVFSFHLPVFNRLANFGPLLAVSGLGLNASLSNIILLLLGSMRLLKLVKICPRIAQVRLQLDSSVKPLARFLYLSLRPEQIGHCQQHIGVMFAHLQRVYALCFSLRLGLEKNGLGPQHTTVRTLLHGPGHQVERNGLVVRVHFQPDRVQPQDGVFGVSAAGLFQYGSGTDQLRLVYFQIGVQDPERDAGRAFFEALLVRVPGQVEQGLVLQQLAFHHPQLGELCK
ncbi:hypothetical protein BpHYR1_019570 [Brachionus plicatilis]|uniref:Uncharacterized protein n=1 Tax=Brachionus plicatilis TaxID=10195 RepID=A0A3M7Q2S8_BRAPC|nr:hypothetical protein BpHYR1_019570 [Brachionus plicatilis]